MPKAKKPAARKRPRRPVRRRGATAAARHRRAIEAALAALAHDIRTPLSGIVALSELLVASDLGERERTWAEGVQSAADHLNQLTTIVCDAVRDDAAGLVLRRDVFSPRRLAETAGIALTARAQANGLSSTLDIESALPERVTGDPVRIRAALENLIDNAVKFTSQGEVALTVRQRKAGRKQHLLFTVSDTGPGLSPAHIRKLFRPFSQVGDNATSVYGGTGLGLALVKRLARAMGGDLTVSSKPGRGSAFTLAVAVDPVAQAAPGETPGSESTRHLRALRILCVEDNPYGRVVLHAVLKELGHAVDFTASGETAVEMVAQGRYDLVLMDVALTGIDGFETARRIRRLGGEAAGVPILGVSARTSPADEAVALEAGMDGYLRKPVSAAALAQEIGKLRLR